jgi:branched-chain amino acid transport system permease protein
MRKKGCHRFSFLLLLLFFCLLPLFIDVDASYFAYYLFLCFCYIVIAQGWNIVGGYTGQISMATHAFFALGAYTTAIIWVRDLTKTGYYFDPLLMFLSGLTPSIFALIIGLPLLYRLRGDYFAFGTLAASEILRTIILRWIPLTYGAQGLRLPGESFTSMRPYYWTGLILAFCSTLLVFLLSRSRIGLAFRALSEDETSAQAHGINVLLFKVLAFVIGSFLIGVCGSLFAYYLLMVNPQSVMNLNWMFIPILICLLGGKGTVMGPVIGSFVVAAIYSYVEVFVGQIHPMISGVLVVLIMKYMPQGIMGFLQRRMG